MSQFSIIGTPLYQWESGRRLKIVPLSGMRIDSVHFSNYGDSDALVVKPKEENGQIIAEIPNILLQDAQNIVVHSVNVSEDKVETIQECVFSVRKRAKPSSYVYTETEVMTYKALDERIKKLEEDGDGGLSDPGEDGGYYIPSVSQVDENTMSVSFEASKEGMTSVPDQAITLPPGKDGKTPDLTGYATEEYVNNAIANVPTSGSKSTFHFLQVLEEDVSVATITFPIALRELIHFNVHISFPHDLKSDLDVMSANLGGTWKNFGKLTATTKGINLNASYYHSVGETKYYALAQTTASNDSAVARPAVGNNTLSLGVSKEMTFYTNNEGVPFPAGTVFDVWGVTW